MKKPLLVIYAACVVLFGLLAYLVNRFSTFPGDSVISSWFAERDLPLVDVVMQIMSSLGETTAVAIMAALIAAMLWLSKKKIKAIFLILTPATATLLSWVLKVAINRPRPNADILETGGYSFPSGHTVYAIAFFGLLFYLLPSLIKNPMLVTVFRIILALVIIMIAVSRVYLGEHWPSDVLGGLLLGGLALWPFIVLYNHYAMERNNA